MIRPFLFWKQELERDVDHGLVEVNCSKKYKQQFVDSIMSMLTDMDNFFVKNDLYKYNDYYQFLSEKFMDRFGYELLYPKFNLDSKLKKECVSGRCEFDENYYNNIKIAKENLLDKATLCHEFFHYLTLNTFYYNHPDNERFKVLVNFSEREHNLILKRKHKTSETKLGEDVMQYNVFFYEGLTEFMATEIYPEARGKAYLSRVKMFEILSELIGKQNIMKDFLQGNINSIEKYFNARTWEGKYVDNFADFLKYTEGFVDDYDNGKSYYLFRELNTNYKNAIKCLMKAYYQNLMKDDESHSAEEFMKLFEFCVDYGALPECQGILQQIVKSGKISGLETQKSKINKMCRAFKSDYADWKCKVGDFVLEIVRGADCINFVLNLGKKNKLNLKFDGVDGFEYDGGYSKQMRQKDFNNNESEQDHENLEHKFNRHSKEYLQFKARATKFADGKKAADMSIELDGNSIMVEFFDKLGEKLHTFCINYGHTKTAKFDDINYNLDADETHTQSCEIL